MKRKQKLTKAEKREKRYGNPLLKQIVTEYPDIEYLYDSYKNCGRNLVFDMVSAFVYLLIGMVFMFLSLFTEKGLFSTAIFWAIGFYWLSEAHRDSDNQYYRHNRILDEYEKYKWREALSGVVEEPKKNNKAKSRKG